MENERIALQCLASAGTVLVMYGILIVSLEVGGLVAGYPGRGREIHEQLMQQLKKMFSGNGNNRPKK